MCSQFSPDRMSHRLQINFEPFGAGELHHWYKVRIAGHEDNDLDNLLEGKTGHIESDPDIDAFLLDVGYEIVCVYCSRRSG